MAESVELVLSAQTAKFVEGLKIAAQALERLRQVADRVQNSVAQSLVGINAASRGLGDSMRATFRGIGTSVTQPLAEIRTFTAGVRGSLNELGAASEIAAGRVSRSVRTIGGAVGGVGPGVRVAGREAAAGFASVGDVIGGGVEKLRGSIFSLQGVIGTLGAGAAFGKIVSTTSAFGEAIAYVGTVLDSKASVPLKKYEEQIIALGGSTTQNAVERSRTLYQILSSGIPATEGASGAGATLEITLKAATAGMANAEDAAKALTGTMNAYKEAGVTAAEASDVLFQTVNRGVVEFPELAQQFGQVSGIAASLGVALPEVGAAIATITKAGIPASVAVTSIRQALVSIAKPPEIVQKRLKALGIEFGTTALAEKGFAGVLQEVIDKTGGSAHALTQLFTDIDGLKAVLALTRGGMVGFKDDIEAIANSAGSTDRAFKLLSETFAFQAGVMKNKLEVVFLAIGKQVLPTLQAALEKLAKFVEANQAEIVSSVGGFLKAMVNLAEFVVANGQTILTFFAALFAFQKINAAASALTAFGASLSGVLAKTAGPGAASAGAEFVARFAGAFPKILTVLGTVLRGASIIGLVITAGVLIGNALGDAIGPAFSASVEKAGREAEANAEAIAARIKARLKEKGFESEEAYKGGKASFERGEMVSFAKGGALEGTSVYTPAEAIDKLGVEPETLRAGAKATAGNFEADAARIREQIKAMQADLAEVEARTASGFKASLAKDVKIQSVRGQITSLVALEDAATKASRAIVAAVETEIEARAVAAVDAEQATKNSANAAKRLADSENNVAGAAESAGKRRQAIAEEIAVSSAVASKQRIANEMAAIEVEKAGLEARLESQLAVAELGSETEMELIAIKQAAFAASAALYQRQAGLIRELAEGEVIVAQAAAQKRLNDFRDSADAQRAISLRLAEDEKSIRIKADEEVRVQTELRAKQSAALIREELDALLKDSAERMEAAFEADDEAEAAGETGALLGSKGRIVQGAQAAKDVITIDAAGMEKAAKNIEKSGVNLSGVLGKLASVTGPVIGTIIGLVNVVAELPAILNGLATLFSTGIDDFAKSLFDSILNVLMSLSTELGPQIIRLLTETVPAFIEALVANLPDIIGGLILLLPQIVWALTKAIPMILIALVKGLITAGGKIIRFFTSGIGGAIISGIKTAFLWVVKILRETATGVVSGDDSFAGRTGRFLGLSAGKKILTGDFDELTAKDIPIVGAFLHSGGQVRGSGSNLGGALAFAAAGAQHFASGGLVSAPGSSARAKLRRVLGGDDVPSILQAGEAVLNRTGARTLGEDGVAALNRGQAPSGLAGPLSASVSLIGRGMAPILQMLLSSVAIDIGSPNGITRQAVQKRVSRAPLMVRAVRGRT